MGRRLGGEAREKMVRLFASPVVAMRMQAAYASLLETDV
jgi:hypothetical protein